MGKNEAKSSKSGGIGRRAGLRIQFLNRSVGSTPSSCTIKKGVAMVQGEHQLSYELQEVKPLLVRISITIPANFVTTIYNEVLTAQKKEAHTHGFPQGATPLSYIEQNYRSNILEHVKEFLFKYFVLQILYQLIQENKLLIAGEPRLENIVLDPHTDATYIFELSLMKSVDTHKWKSLPFKAPRRKNYKDIDRQVETFIKEEQDLISACACDTVEVGDWVGFAISVLDQNQKPCFGAYRENLWLKIGDEEADIPFQELFVNRKNGDTFCCNHKCLQEFFSCQVNTSFNFCVKIHSIIKHGFFSFDHFKRHFKLKTNKDVHKKLIEVYSFRNDLSLRRSIADEALKLLITKHQVEAPPHMVLRQQKKVLEAVHNNPDYHVYKTQSTFKDYVYNLAEKQARESLIIDQLCLQENMRATQDDIAAYLNLFNRPRTKEFIYFNPPSTKLEGQEMPINESLISISCQREKTLNHVIYHLTRK